MKKSVFIVDDDEMFSGLLEAHLSGNKLLQVNKFSTGEQALNELTNDLFAVILDYNLDTVDKNAANGLDILKEIKKTFPDIHAIMLSAQTRYGVAANSIKEGAEQYVMKDEAAFEKINEILNAIIKENRRK
ncbi:MAG: response regulator [Bacteroidia bacterium]|nr:response regulator [Bacteroidia bacterium]